MRIGAGERDVEMITPALCRETALPGWPRAAVRRDPVAEHRLGRHEAPPGLAGVVPFAVPRPVDKDPVRHRYFSCLNPPIQSDNMSSISARTCASLRPLRAGT